MSWNKKSSGLIDATCDNCGTGIVGTQQYLKDKEWTVLENDDRSACCQDCIDNLEEKGMDCPECSSEMDVDVLIHMSKSGPRGIKSFVCNECGEKLPLISLDK